MHQQTGPATITLRNDKTAPTPPRVPVNDTVIAVAVFLVAVLFLLQLLHFSVFNPDEGVTIHGAERLLAGQVPYRDFFAVVTPGSFYLMAAQFRVFGHSLVAARIAMLLYGGVFAALTYSLARRFYGRLPSLLSSFLVLLSMTPMFIAVHNWDSTFFAFLAVYSAHRWLDGRANVWAIAVGLATSTTIVFEQSKGAGLVLGLALAVIALGFRSRSARNISNQNIVWFLTGMVIPLAATVVHFAHHGALTALTESVLWPLRHYSGVNQVPYGWMPGLQDTLLGTGAAETWTHRIILIFVLSPLLLIPVLAAAVVGMSFFWVWLRVKRDDDCSTLDHRILGGCVFIGIWLSVFATRRDVTHLVFVLPMFGYLIPGILDLQEFSTERLRQVRTVLAVYMVIAFAVFGLGTLQRGIWANTKFGSMTTTPELAELNATLERKMGHSKRLYIHPYQAFIYATTGTKNPTRFDFLFPGMNTLDDYREAAEQLEADRTPYVLLDAAWGGKVAHYWPSTPAAALASDPVSEYVLENYRLCTVLARQGAYRYYLMARKDSTCPQ